MKVRWSQAARGEHRSLPRAGSWAVSLVVVHRYPSCSHGTRGEAATTVIASRFSHFSTHDLIPSGVSRDSDRPLGLLRRISRQNCCASEETRSQS
jgi:hypothetical protein